MSRHPKIWTANYDPIVDWFVSRPVLLLRAGDNDVARCRIMRGGWYIERYCGRCCCRPEGPFKSMMAALRWARRQAISIKRQPAHRPHHWNSGLLRRRVALEAAHALELQAFRRSGRRQPARR